MEFGLSGAFADTLESVSTWISPGLIIFPGCNSGTPLLSESARACQHNFDSFPATAHATRDCTSDDRAARRGSVHATWCEVGHGPIAHHLSPIAKILAPASVVTVSAEAWDEASVVA
jgi:hypothetical protein